MFIQGCSVVETTIVDKLEGKVHTFLDPQKEEIFFRGCIRFSKRNCVGLSIGVGGWCAVQEWPCGVFLFA